MKLPEFSDDASPEFGNLAEWQGLAAEACRSPTCPAAPAASLLGELGGNSTAFRPSPAEAP